MNITMNPLEAIMLESNKAMNEKLDTLLDKLVEISEALKNINEALSHHYD